MQKYKVFKPICLNFYVLLSSSSFTHSYVRTVCIHFYSSIVVMEAGGEQERLDMLGAAAGAEPSFSGLQQTSTNQVWPSLDEAVRLKNEGNALYREKNIRSAIGRYHRALLVLRGLDSDVMTSVKGFGPEAPVLTPEQLLALRNTQLDCYNNLAGSSNNTTSQP